RRLLRLAARDESLESLRADCDCSRFPCKFLEKCRRSSELRPSRRELCCRRRLHKPRRTRISVGRPARILRTRLRSALYFSAPIPRPGFSPHFRPHPPAPRARSRPTNKRRQPSPPNLPPSCPRKRRPNFFPPPRRQSGFFDQPPGPAERCAFEKIPRRSR